MITGAMSTTLKKRRVVYCGDTYWDYIKNLAKQEGKSVSEVLREILKEKIK